METLFFTLGMLMIIFIAITVITVISFVKVLKLQTRLTKATHESWDRLDRIETGIYTTISSSNQDSSRELEEFRRDINQENDLFNTKIDMIYSYIDSRIDKTFNSMSKTTKSIITE